MTGRSLDIVVIGLSLSSSWGNGHATTYRALLAGLRELGHRVTFLERDKPWYAANRDLPHPDFCDFSLYDGVGDLLVRFGDRIAAADVVVVGSYVPDGIELIDEVAALAGGKLAFYDIDTPITLSRLERGEEEYLAARQIPLFDLYLSFTGGPTLRRIERSFGAPLAAALYCSVDEVRYRPSGEPRQWDLGYLGTFSPDRQPTLERLLIEPARRLPHLRFVVAGPQYPAGIDWPANVERIEHLPPSEHASFYSRQRYTLNVTRADMIAAGWSPSVRLFEAAACGTPIISDDWPGLAELFTTGEAIVVAKSSDEVVEILVEGADAPRDAMAAAARRTVLAAHTGIARAGDFIRAVEAAGRARGRGRPIDAAVGAA